MNNFQRLSAIATAGILISSSSTSTFAMNITAPAPEALSPSSPAVPVGQPFVLHTISDDATSLWPVYFRYEITNGAPLGVTGHLEAIKGETTVSVENTTATLVSEVPLTLQYDAQIQRLKLLNYEELGLPVTYGVNKDDLCLQMTASQVQYTIGGCSDAFSSSFIREEKTTTEAKVPNTVDYTQRMIYNGDSIERCMSFRAESYYYNTRSYQSVEPNCIANSVSHNQFEFKEVDAGLYETKEELTDYATTTAPTTIAVKTSDSEKEAPNAATGCKRRIRV